MIRVGRNICIENKQEFNEHWDAYNEKFDGNTILSDNLDFDFNQFPLFLLYDDTQKQQYYYGTYKVVSSAEWLLKSSDILVELEKNLKHTIGEFYKAKNLLIN